MIARRKTPTVFYNAAVRERSSLAAVSAAHQSRFVEERRLQHQQTLVSTAMRPTMGRVGYKKRTLATATAAVAYFLPSYSGFALAVGDCSNNHANNRLYHTIKQPSTNHQNAVPTASAPLLEVLRTLISRLNEPVPLRAKTTAPSSEGQTPTIVEEKRRMAELAEELVARYASLPPLRRFGMKQAGNSDVLACERSDILEFLATECCPSESKVQTAVEEYQRQQHLSNNYEKLKGATTPSYEGFTDFVMGQNAVTGMGFLVALREDLLSSLRYQTQEQHDASTEAKVWQQRFRDLDSHLKSGVFQGWFAPGLLSHERITYDSTPAKIIEAIATKEAVHPMKSLEDLKERLGSSKRVFALFHPCLPNQPLVFVHVALLPHGLPSSMEQIMVSNNTNNIEQEHRPQVAAFYSISNGVKGLAGVGLGEYLLKESIRALKEELPCLETFVTLSPIPKFRKWIKVAVLKEEQKHQQRLSKGEEEESSSSLLSKADREALYRCGLISSASPFPWEEFLDNLEEIDFPKLIEEGKTTSDKDVYSFLLRNNSESSTEPKDEQDKDPSMIKRKQFFVLRSVLLKLASSYLWLEKHRGKPLDKVCGFHVGNGAELHDLHFGADLSRGGLSNSYGIMANYLYDTDQVSRNQANFESSGFVVPIGEGVRKWLEEIEE